MPLLERLKFLRHLRQQPRRVLHGARGGAARPRVAPASTPRAGRARPSGVLRRDRAIACATLEGELEAILHGDDLPRRWRRRGSAISTLAECTRGRAPSASTSCSSSEIFPVLTPLAVGPGRPFPYISNLSLIARRVRARPGHRRAAVRARQGAARCCRGSCALGARRALRPLEDVIADNLDRLFPGMEVIEHATVPRHPRRRLRRSPRTADDLLEAVEQELHRRRFGDVVRLEVEDVDVRRDARPCSSSALRRRTPTHVYRAPRPLDLADFFPLASLDRPDLHYPPWTPQTQPRLQRRPAHGRHVRGDPPRRHPRAPPVRRVRHVRRALHRAGRRRPRRARDQADHVPHVRRLADRAGR